jgi:branched-subunit amino acid aminotransferase/4-amino-4-deoxychorismate lyase
VIELAADLGVAVDDQPFDLDRLSSADEAFLTSSLRGIAPLTRVDGRSIGSGAPGDLTRRLMNAYAALIERECGA